MGNVQIITDSTCDLTPDIIRDNSIKVVPLYVTFNENMTYKDGVDITPAKLYEEVKVLGQTPKTAAPSPADFCEVFRPCIDKGQDIIYIGLSSQISSTIQNAKIAACEFPEGRVKVIDSQNLSAGIGYLVLKAVDLANKGLDIKTISNDIVQLVPKVKTFFAIDTLEYLYKGGRCSSVENFFGSMLKIRPILHLAEGRIHVHQKIRGKRKKLLDSMLEILNTDKNQINTNKIIINHSMCEEDAEYLRSQISQLIKCEQIITVKAGCVISSHCGPNTFSIVYCID
ncbi:DegV family protein [Serpentinicella sp. ANB-PHB4]|uniref:DegV family protein n=1 Tax=Serpentinicella sp. ANB-PHB4 TaxID=3074076 RepID=UPI002856FEE5|nr:DegV family protein [Serpentinicella sp. ANB-PHB4]MDR5658985.1 DegV family protein [Serpentinicella sp. ANB-PHB4]